MEGKLTYGDGLDTKTVRIQLADTENPYRPISRMLLPERNDIVGGDQPNNPPTGSSDAGLRTVGTAAS